MKKNADDYTLFENFLAVAYILLIVATFVIAGFYFAGLAQ